MTKNKIIPLTKEIPAVELNAEGKLRGGFQAMSLNSGSNITGGCLVGTYFLRDDDALRIRQEQIFSVGA